MPVAPDVRAYAGAALAKSLAALGQAGSAVHLATDRAATAIEEVPRPSYLALGLADVAVAAFSRRAEAATKRVEHLPLDAVAGYSRAQHQTRARLTKGQEEAVAALAKAQEEALARAAVIRERLRTGRSTLPAVPHLPDRAAARDAVRGAAEGYLGRSKQAY